MVAENVPSCGPLPQGGWSCNPRGCGKTACPMDLLWALYREKEIVLYIARCALDNGYSLRRIVSTAHTCR